MPPWWLPRGGISLNILIASGAWMYNETYFLFACVQKRICDFMCAWMRYARVRKTEKPRVPHVQGLVENRNSGMRSTPRHHPIERPIALHSLPARPMRPDSHASLNLKPTHWLKPTYYTCNKGLTLYCKKSCILAFLPAAAMAVGARVICWLHDKFRRWGVLREG